MKKLQKISSGYEECCFIPIIYDIVVPSEQKSIQKVKNIFLVMEFEDSDLKQAIKQGVLTGISQEHLKLVIYNLLCAVKYCHSANVLHRDIKPANILINKDCQVKLCDFGISRTLPESLLGKGSGNSKRIRDSIFKHNLRKD